VASLPLPQFASRPPVFFVKPTTTNRPAARMPRPATSGWPQQRPASPAWEAAKSAGGQGPKPAPTRSREQASRGCPRVRPRCAARHGGVGLIAARARAQSPNRPRAPKGPRPSGPRAPGPQAPAPQRPARARAGARARARVGIFIGRNRVEAGRRRAESGRSRSSPGGIGSNRVVAGRKTGRRWRRYLGP
jgi:hypothetical protein